MTAEPGFETPAEAWGLPAKSHAGAVSRSASS